VAIQKFASPAEVIPVWTPECEEHDGTEDGLCGGVSCYGGECWEEYTRQLTPLADAVPRLGALLLARQFGQDASRGRDGALWVAHAVEHAFQTMPEKYGGRVVPPDRIIVVLQGWEVAPEETQAQLDRVLRTNPGGVVISRVPIDQSWQPRVIPLEPSR
jgi:hypothetical protein